MILQKGGAGKTTTAVNLAAALGELGLRLLVIDLDPQCNASRYLGVTDLGRGLFEVFTEGRDLASLAQTTLAPGVDLIAGSEWLVGIDKALAGEVGAETILRRALKALPARWDVVLLDCPPSLGTLAVSALVASDEFLVPVEMSAMALEGVRALMRTVQRVRERLNPQLGLAGVLACRFVGRTNLAHDCVDSLRKHFPGDVFASVIRENVRLKEAYSFGKPITLYAPESSGAEDYRAAAAEFLARAKGPQTTKATKGKKGKR